VLDLSIDEGPLSARANLNITIRDLFITQKSNIEYFYTLKKTLETHPELAAPEQQSTCVDVRQASQSPAEVEEELTEVEVDKKTTKPAVRRRSRRFGKLSLLTKPAGSDTLLMWDAPKVRPNTVSDTCWLTRFYYARTSVRSQGSSTSVSRSDTIQST
jgi:hypothetical protein